MNLHTDIPTRVQVDQLLDNRRPASVTIYLSTDPVSNGQAERIELGNLASEAERQLVEAGTAKAEVAAVADSLADLIDDSEFWRFQARSLAVFVTPDSARTFRLPNRLRSAVEVSDRFHIKPLLRALTFPQVALVLALAQGSVRLIEVAPDVEPGPVDVPDLPSDVASWVGKSSIRDRSPSRRLQGSEGRKVRMRQYARGVDQALRPLVAGLGVPLILAAAEPLDSIYRSVSTYPLLAASSITGNPRRGATPSSPPPARCWTSSTRQPSVRCTSSTGGANQSRAPPPISPSSPALRRSAWSTPSSSTSTRRCRAASTNRRAPSC
jgi:Bacterial archaeo-eukaryotic release factor family 11